MQYDVLIETINPCGGEKHAIRTFKEVETDDPVAWVNANGNYPVTDTITNPEGDIIVISSFGEGYMDRYTFTK